MSDKLQVSGEWVSSLMDGQLQGEVFAHAVERLEVSNSAREAWDAYHLVGEIMRTGVTTLPAQDALFMERLRRQMSSNAPDCIANEAQEISAADQNSKRLSASNDAWWRRVAGLASVAVVGVLAWQGATMLDRGATQGTVALTQRPAQSVEVAASPFVPTTDTAPNVMLRDPQLDALLAAHRQLGGATALQTPSGFLRNATLNEASH